MAKDDDKKEAQRIRLGALLFALCVTAGLALLWWGKFTGGDFVAFFGLSAAICFVIGLVPYVEEFSIGKNLVKLRDSTDRAAVVMERLSNLTQSFYKTMFEQYQERPSDKLSDALTANYLNFISLHKDLQDRPEVNMLRGSIAATAGCLLSYQYDRLASLNPSALKEAAALPGNELPDPDSVRALVLEKDQLSNSLERYRSRLSSWEGVLMGLSVGQDEYVQMLDTAVKAYETLYYMHLRYSPNAPEQ